MESPADFRFQISDLLFGTIQEVIQNPDFRFRKALPSDFYRPEPQISDFRFPIGLERKTSEERQISDFRFRISVRAHGNGFLKQIQNPEFGNTQILHMSLI